MSKHQPQYHKLCNHLIALFAWALLALFLPLSGLAASPHALDLATVLTQRMKMTANTAINLEADFAQDEHVRVIVKLHPPPRRTRSRP